MCAVVLYCFAVWRHVWFFVVLNDLHPLCLERDEGFLRVRYTMDAFPSLEQSVGSCSSPKSCWARFTSNDNGRETRHKLIKWDGRKKKKKWFESGYEYTLERTSLFSTGTIADVHLESLCLGAVEQVQTAGLCEARSSTFCEAASRGTMWRRAFIPCALCCLQWWKGSIWLEVSVYNCLSYNVTRKSIFFWGGSDRYWIA